MTEKLKPIEVDKGQGSSEIMDVCHEVFKETIANKDRPRLGDREIYVPLKWIEHKAEIFWHSASIEEKAKLDIQPCNNDVTSAKCEANCITGKDTIKLSNGDVRAKCIYRATRINLIKSVIELYNDGDVRVQYWEKVNSKKRNRIYLRYQEEEIDFIIVFDEKSSKRVQLVTAYPVFFISAKRDYTKDYKNYAKKPVIAVRKPDSPSNRVR